MLPGACRQEVVSADANPFGKSPKSVFKEVSHVKKSETPVRISAAGSAALAQRRGKTLGQRILENWQMYALLAIPVILTIIYKYIPMYGIQIAFRDFKASKGYMGSE